MSENSSNTEAKQRTSRLSGLGGLARVLIATLWIPAMYAFSAIVMGILAGAFVDEGWMSETAFDQLYSGSEPARLLGELIFKGLLFALVVPPTYGYLIGKDIPWSVTLGVQRLPNVRDFWLPLIAFIGYFAISYAILILVIVFSDGFDPTQTQNLGFDPAAGWGTMQYVVTFILVVVMAPVIEELLFRGYMFSALRRISGFWFTTITVSAVFGIVHGQWNVGIDVFVLSLFLCYLREKTGAIWAPIVLHMLKNGLAYYSLFIYPLLVPTGT